MIVSHGKGGLVNATAAVKWAGVKTGEVSATTVASGGTVTASDGYSNAPIEICFNDGGTIRVALIPIEDNNNDTLDSGAGDENLGNTTRNNVS